MEFKRFERSGLTKRPRYVSGGGTVTRVLDSLAAFADCVLLGRGLWNTAGDVLCTQFH